MIELEAALERMLQAIEPLPVECVALAAARGRVLAEAVNAPVDLPHFDNSSMDGYAVRASDVRAAAPGRPVELKLAGVVAAGGRFAGTVAPGCCVRIFTGSPLPAGSDAVVMQEDTRASDAEPERVQILESVKPWENVRLRGEDVKQGDAVVEAGQVLGPGGIALLGALGLAEIRARRQPVVAVLATGSELVEAGQPLTEGRIYESNRTALAPLLAQLGAAPRIHPLVRDTLGETRRALERAFSECDAAVTSGGVSVGEFDFVKQAFEELGGKLEFWKVAIKPGRPFVFGRCGGKCLFGLPGNPVSALVTCWLLVGPAVRHMQGAADTAPASYPGTVVEPLANPGPRRHFMRVIVDGNGGVRPAGAQASHILGALARVNGLADVPANATLPVGATVKVIRFE